MVLVDARPPESCHHSWAQYYFLHRSKLYACVEAEAQSKFLGAFEHTSSRCASAASAEPQHHTDCTAVVFSRAMA
eukprot:CAMPEP_0178422694 /NCGR_PEP_ID=MMETSP0689_2-20121128/27306_1 /TAXON_ID=160604 /ORGANISM="Amphidinium massartii, Strain CS-259" /LENGTH=74 /DNA_ID=CAMNT_0020044267 /DNA_START=57 /DNA_END=278 /DNA_ORIENTATION=+